MVDAVDSGLKAKDVETLLGLSLAPYSLVAHDLRNKLDTVDLALHLLEGGSKSKSSSLSRKKSRELITTARSAINQAEALMHLLIPYTTVDRSLSGFSSRPSRIVDALKRTDRARRATLSTDEASDKSLEFLYPESVLTGLLSELIENSVRHSRRKHVAIVIGWSINSKRFTCTVDDNGNNPSIAANQKHLPLKVFREGSEPDAKQPQGLDLVERIIRLSSGRLFFSRSPKLRGLRVLFEIPMIGEVR